MNLTMGSNVFFAVRVPILWGKRAILQDPKGRIFVFDLGGEKANAEILADRPAPGIEYTPSIEGFQIFHNGNPSYSYSPSQKKLSSLESKLPDCEIGSSEIKVGSNVFSGNSIVGAEVGIAITEQSVGLGSRLPEGLANLEYFLLQGRSKHPPR
jgi:hypothetical protein